MPPQNADSQREGTPPVQKHRTLGKIVGGIIPVISLPFLLPSLSAYTSLAFDEFFLPLLSHGVTWFQLAAMTSLVLTSASGLGVWLERRWGVILFCAMTSAMGLLFLLVAVLFLNTQISILTLIPEARALPGLLLLLPAVLSSRRGSKRPQSDIAETGQEIPS